MDISVIVPLYNESESLPELEAWIDRVMKENGFSYEIIFINDGSTDSSWKTIEDLAKSINMPYVIERWPGGMLTNFPTIRKAVKKMASIDKMTKDGTFDNLSKREKLQITRQRAKLEKNLGSIADLNRLPSALFVVDVAKEHIAVAEANRLGIPVFAIVDTNSNPNDVDYIIPANDDASKSIDLILSTVCEAINEGLAERKVEKADEKAASENGEAAARREGSRRRVNRRADSAEAPASEETAEAPVAEVAE